MRRVGGDGRPMIDDPAAHVAHVAADPIDAQVLQRLRLEVRLRPHRRLICLLVQLLRQGLQDLATVLVVLEQRFGELGQLRDVLDAGPVEEVVHADLEITIWHDFTLVGLFKITEKSLYLIIKKFEYPFTLFSDRY